MHESDSYSWLEVANVDEIPVGTMKHVEVNDREIAIANVNGKFYAIDDRCGHMNARLSLGGLRGNIVTCPQHGAQFDVTTGRKQAEPRLGGNDPRHGQTASIIPKHDRTFSEDPGRNQDLRPANLRILVDGKSIKLKVNS